MEPNETSARPETASPRPFPEKYRIDDFGLPSRGIVRLGRFEIHKNPDRIKYWKWEDLDAETKAEIEYFHAAVNAYDANQAEIARLREALERAEIIIDDLNTEGYYTSFLQKIRAALEG